MGGYDETPEMTAAFLRHASALIHHPSVVRHTPANARAR
jgi:hypothetical protein